MKLYRDNLIPEPHPTREGWLCISDGTGGMIGWERRSPSIQANHIDGPLLHFSDGQLHWLTPWERILFALGLTDAEKLERKRRPNLCKAYGS